MTQRGPINVTKGGQKHLLEFLRNDETICYIAYNYKWPCDIPGQKCPYASESWLPGAY